MPSRFKNDCLTSVCDYALTRILGLDFIYIYWYDFIVYDCIGTDDDFFIKLSTAIQNTMLTQ